MKMKYTFKIIAVSLALLLFSLTQLRAQISANVSTDTVTCAVNRARIVVNVTLGSGPYDYILYQGAFGGPIVQQSLGNPSATHNFNSIPAGSYTVVVSNGFIYGSPITLTEVKTTALTVLETIVTKKLSCPEGSDANLLARVVGGNPPYTYLWSPGGETTPNKNGVGRGIYTVTVNDSYNCGTTSTKYDLFFDEAHDSFPTVLVPGSIAIASTQTCYNSTPAPITSSTPATGGWGFTYQWQRNSTTLGGWTNILGATAVGFTETTPLTEATQYRRAAISTFGCGTEYSNVISITINPLPTTFDVTGGGNYCSGGAGVAIGLGGSQSGVNYQLYRGAVAIGSTVAGTGAAISFGNQTIAGTYTVVATNGTTSCTANMNGNAVVTIDPLPTLYNVTGGGSFCSGGAGVAVGLSNSDIGFNYQLYRGAAAIGAPVAGTGAALNFGNQTVAGTYTVTSTNTVTGCIATMTGNAVVTVNPLPTAYNMTGGGAYCSGGTGMAVGLSGSESGVNYQLYRDGNPVGGVIPGTGLAISFGNQTVAGTYTAVATNSVTSCTANMTGSVAVSVNPLPGLFNVTGGGSFCSGGTGVPVGIDGSEVGVNYRLYRGASAVGGSRVGTGAAISFGNQTVAGTYTVRATNATTTCISIMNGNAIVTVNPLPTLYNVTGGGTYCSGGTGVAVGLSNSSSGTNYQLLRDGNPVGAAIAGTGGALNFGNQTIAGTYTVSATITATGCTTTMTGSAIVSVNPLPTVYNVTGGGSYCSGGTGVAVGLSGSQSGVNYQLYRGATTVGSAVSGTGAAISFGNQTVAGTYTVVATNGTTSCTANMSGNAIISIDLLPTSYNVSGGGSYCSGGAGVSIGLSNSDIGFNYQLYRGAAAIGAPIAGTGAALNFGNQTVAGTYTVTSTNTVTGCVATMTGNAVVTVNPLPASFNMTGGGAYCSGGTGVAVGLSGSESGVNYQLYRDGNPVGGVIPGTGLAISFGNQTIAGTYTAVATNSITSCTANMTGSVVISINPLPVAFNVTGGGSFCSGGTGVAVGLSGSEAGINYQLYLGAATAGSPVAGTGAAISFGNQTAAGTYTVVATNGTTSCTSNMTGSVVVTINPLPTIYNVTGGGSYCSGGTGVAVGLSNSDAGTNYQLLRDGNPVGAAVAGTGGALNFGNQTVAGTYTVLATITATGCTNTMTGSAIVSINPLPTVYIVTGGGNYCSGGTGVNIGLSGSEVGVNYQLYRGAAPIGSVVAGTGTAISFGNQTTAGTYTVVATNTSTTCTVNMNGNAIVSIDPLPTAYNVTGGGSYCSGGAGVSVGLSNSDPGFNYQLYRGASAIGAPIAGTGAALNFGNQTVAGTYTVRSTNTVTGCIATMTGNALVTVNPLPAVFNITGGGDYCSGGPGLAVGLSGSVSGINYQLYRDGNPVGGVIPGTGLAISFGNQTIAGTYTAVATNSVTSCTANMTGSVVININPLPVAFNVTGGGSFCSGDTGVAVGLSGSEAGINYQLYLGAATAGSPVAGTGAAISFGNQTAAGTYTVVATNGTTSCTSNMTGNVVVTINPLPTIYNVTGGGSYCSGGTGVAVGLSNSDAGTNYQLLRDGNPVGAAVAGTGGALNFGNQTVAGTYTVLATITATGCTNVMTGSAMVSINPLPTVYDVTGGGSYCSGGTGVNIGLLGSETGVNYQLYLGAAPIGSVVAGTGAAIGFGNQTTAGTYTVVATNASTTCTANMNGNAIVSINPLPVVTASNNGPICEGSSLQLFGGLNPANTYSWTGPQGFTANIQNPIVSNNATILMGGTYTVTATDINNCSANATTVVVVEAAPVVDAGNDTSICNSDVVPLNGASITGGTIDRWRTSGDGTFNDNTIINPVYTPGIVDRNFGSVTLYLDANGTGSCGLFTDSILVAIPLPVQPAIGAPAPYYIAATTEMKVCVSTSGHQRNLDMGYYLIAPDGTTVVTLARAPMETNYTTPCLPFTSGIPGDATDLCFTNNPVDPLIDICTAPRPLTGNYLAEGSWSALYGMNPSQGGWTVMIKDTANNRPTPHDGFVTEASVSFTDIAIATGTAKLVEHSSGAINDSIFESANNRVVLRRDLSVSCFGECDAQAIVSVTGGTPPYTNYVWSPIPTGGNGTDTVFLCAGTYNLTVTDALGCSGSTSVNVIEPPQIIINEAYHTDSLRCNGVADGQIVVKASGGTGTISYTLIPGNIPSESADSGLFTGLSAGNYTVRAADASNCYVEQTFTIAQPTSLVLVSAIITDSIHCFGDNDGRIVAQASGGRAPHMYILIPFADTNSTGIFENLPPANYRVKVTDAYGCDTLFSDTLKLSTPGPLFIDTVIAPGIICQGDLATIRVVGFGGRKPYRVSVDGGLTWAISNVIDTAVINGLAAGVYNIVLEDNNLCQAVYPAVTITGPSTALSIDDINIIPVTGCSNNANGEIEVIASGGWGAYTYSLDNIIYSPVNVFTGLVVNNYSVYVRDSLGCTIVQMASVTGPSPLVGNPIIINVQGDVLGSITFFPIGGTPPYEYWVDSIFEPDTALRSWTTNPLFDSLPAGTYYAAVRDAEGCLWEDILEVEVDVLDVMVTVTNPLCEGDGIINIAIFEGTPPFDIYINGFLFGTESSTPPFAYEFLIGAGTYSIEVIDVTGMSYDTTVSVITPEAIAITSTVTRKTCQTEDLSGNKTYDGSILSSVTGGTGELTYQLYSINLISGDFLLRTSDTGWFNGLGEYVWYRVRVTDDNGCFRTDSIFMDSDHKFYPELQDDTTLCWLNRYELRSGTGNYATRVSWSPDSVFDDPGDATLTRPTITVNSPMTLQMRLYDAVCQYTDEIVISMFDTVGMKFNVQTGNSIFNPETKTVTAGENSRIEVTLPIDYHISLLSDEYSFEPGIRLIDIGLIPSKSDSVYNLYASLDIPWYLATGITNDGCVEGDTLFVTIRQAVPDTLYNVFTPNGDNSNEYWVIPNADQYPDIEVEVYDRWGQLVFYRKGYGGSTDEMWDGKSMRSNKDVPVGTYLYIIKLNDGQSKPLTGTVTIIR